MTGHAAPRPWNERSFRRLIVDMHMGDWDPGFLQRYDPKVVRDACLAANAQAVMLYFQSHVGLCYWPTASGRQHAACAGRDLIGDTLEVFHERGLPVCAYYSVIYNNWAYLEHPEWRLVPACPGSASILHQPRYGLVCLNNPSYREFVRAQAAEIARYEIDACFFDMIWWNGVCLCPHCLDRCRRETGADLPRTVDWLAPEWCAFQQARERWLGELACELRSAVHAVRPGIQVYHNFALALADWTRAVSFESAECHDFLGGDFYGGREEQLVVSRLMLNLSRCRPVEFMTTVAANLIEHDRQRESGELAMMAGAALGCASAYMLIAPVNPDGTMQQAAIERAGTALALVEPYESWIGGEPVEDVAVYCSSDSKMNFHDNGRSITDIPASSSASYPHGRAVMGACRILQQAQVPFGVITRRQLGSLGRYKVVVLPDVLRMTRDEVDAFREYVRGGGKLYASRYTSLTESAGIRHASFMLEDVFGCAFDAAETGAVIYLRPVGGELAGAIAPDELATHRFAAAELTGALRLRPVAAGGTVLATLTLPYGYPEVGTVEDRRWATIHTMPAWQHTELPVVVERDYGAGRSIYSAADLEGGGTAVQDRLFLALIRRLLGREASFEARAHPTVWMTAFDQRDRHRQVVSLLSYQAELPALPVPSVEFRLRPPAGQRFTRLLRLPEATPVPASLDGDGVLSARITDLQGFTAFSAEYAEAER